MGRREYIRERNAHIIFLWKQNRSKQYADVAKRAREDLDDLYIDEETVRNAIRSHRKEQDARKNGQGTVF
jgi:hypothetical protein